VGIVPALINDHLFAKTATEKVIDGKTTEKNGNHSSEKQSLGGAHKHHSCAFVSEQ